MTAPICAISVVLNLKKKKNPDLPTHFPYMLQQTQLCFWPYNQEQNGLGLQACYMYAYRRQIRYHKLSVEFYLPKNNSIRFLNNSGRILSCEKYCIIKPDS